MNTLPGSIQEQALEQVRQQTGQFGGFAVYNRPPSAKQAVFYDHPMETATKSKDTGMPQFVTKTHVRIYVSGKQNPLFEGLADAGHIAEFPEAYAAYKKGQEMIAEGFPLFEWAHPKMTKGRVETARRFNIHTLEQLAAADTGWISQMGPEWMDVQRAARAYLEGATKQQSKREVNDLHERLALKEKEIEALREQMEDISRKFAEVTNTKYEPAATSKAAKARKGEE
jgi:hypothetical protein